MTEYKNGTNAYTVSTLCEVCQNACGGCTWSRYGVQKPVDGWEAIWNDLVSNHGGVSNPFFVTMESYVVLSCPQYVPDHFAKRYPFNQDTAKRRAKIRITMSEKMKGLAICDT